MPNGRDEKPNGRGALPSTDRAPRGKGLLSRQRSGAAGGAPVQASANPYRPYSGAGEAAGPYLSGPNRPQHGRPYYAPPPVDESIERQAHRRHPFALFHDGNAGHLWRGEVASILGDTLLSTGVLMWLLALTSSPLAVALAVLALALPVVLAIPLSVLFENAAEPGVPLVWLGRFRVLAAVVFAIMHFFVNPNIITPAYAVLFALSFLGRLRAGARVAAERACLAPGEVETVASDLHIGASVAAVLGPLLATALFVLGSAHIILIAGGAIVCYLLSANSEGFLDALPLEERAYMLAIPLPPSPDEATDVSGEQADVSLKGATGLSHKVGAAGAEETDATTEEANEDPYVRRERLLPVWYVQGPRTLGEGLRDLFGGLAAISTTRRSTLALAAIALLAFVGSGLATILLPYLVYGLGVSSFQLGPVLAAEAAGLALGSLLVSGNPKPRAAVARLALGFAIAGVGLFLLVALRRAPLIYVGTLIYGLAGGIAIVAARSLLFAKRSGPAQRAIGASEEMVTALAGVVGVLMFPLFAYGADALPLAGVSARLFPGWPLADSVLGAAVALVMAGPFFFLLLSMQPKAKHAQGSGTGQTRYTRSVQAQAVEGTIGRLLAQEGDAAGRDDNFDDFESSRSMRQGNWRDDSLAWDQSQAWDRSRVDDAPRSSRGAGSPGLPRYGGGGYARDDYDDEDDGYTGYDDDGGYTGRGPRSPGRPERGR